MGTTQEVLAFRNATRILAPIAFAVLALLFFFVPAGRVRGQGPARITADLDVILLIDNSQGMSTTDPGQLRIQVAKSIVDTLIDNGVRYGLRHRVGVMSFGLNVTATAPLTYIPSSLVEKSIRSAYIPGSDFRDPLTKTLEQFETSKLGTPRRRAVVLLTDGHPRLGLNPLTEEGLRAYFTGGIGGEKGKLPDIIQALEAENARVFIVAFNDQETDRNYWWQLVPRENYFSVDSEAGLDKVVSELLGRATLSATPSPTLPTLTAQPSMTQTIPPSSTMTSTLTPSVTSTPTITPTALVVGPVVTPTPTGAPFVGTRALKYIILLLGILLLIVLVSLVILAIRGVRGWRLHREDENGLQEMLRKDWGVAQELAKDTSKREEALVACENVLEAVEGHEVEEARRFRVEVQGIIELMIEQLSVDLREQRTRIYSEVQRRGTIFLNALANYLISKRWAREPEYAIDEIYGSLEAGGPWRLLSFIGRVEPLNGDTASEAITAICRSLAAVYVPSDEKLEEQIGEVTAHVRDAFKKGMKQEILSAQEGYKLYAYFWNLTRQLKDQPFPIAEAPDLPQAVPTAWREAIEICNRGFVGIRTSNDWLEALKKVEEEAHNRMRGPEGRIISTIAKLWSDHIRDIPCGPAKLTLQLAPTLTIDENPERRSSLPLVIRNTGTGVAFQIKLTISNGPEGAERELGSSRINAIRPGPVVVTEVPFNSTEISREDILLSVEYDDPESDTATQPEPVTKTWCMFNLKDIPEDEQVFPNPYVADRPVRKNEPFVSSKSRVDKLFQRIKDQDSAIIHFWGLRRTGKTSLLYRMFDEMERDSLGCLQVYVNCIIFERKEPWSSDEFLAITASVLRARIMEEDEFQSVNLEIEYEGGETEGKRRVSNLSFTNFIKQALKVLDGRKLLLCFDDADVFGEEALPNRSLLFPDFSEEVLELFYRLVNLPDSAGFFVIFSTEKAIGNLWSGQAIVPVEQNSQRVHLLNRGETRQLAHWDGIPLRYSDLAFEYLWRVTGGHPALSQLVCSRVISEWRESNHKPTVIPVAFVRRAVRNLIFNADLEGYFRYIYHYSVPEEARLLLETMVRESRINENTLQVIVEEKDDDGSLHTLTTNEILARDNKGYIMRVGFFKLWLENWGKEVFGD